MCVKQVRITIFVSATYTMKHLLIFITLLVSLSGFGQKVKITEMNQDYTKFANVAGLYYLHDQTNPENYDWIADAVIEFDTILPNTLKEIFAKIEEKGNKIGANAFRISDSDIYVPGPAKYIRLSVYYLRKEKYNENLILFERPVIYLFGFLSHHQHIDGYKIAVNKQKLILEELRYKVLEPEVGTEVKVKLDTGVKSDEVKTSVEKNALPRYYKFDLFKGIVSGGVISEHEWSFAEMLIRILKAERMAM